MTVVVVRNPKPMSRTRAAAEMVAEKLTGVPPDHVIDVIDLGAGLLGWGDPKVAVWLPTDDDRSHVASVMRPVHEPGRFASWLTPPGTGVNTKPVDFEYVKL